MNTKVNNEIPSRIAIILNRPILSEIRSVCKRGEWPRNGDENNYQSNNEINQHRVILLFVSCFSF